MPGGGMMLVFLMVSAGLTSGLAVYGLLAMRPRLASRLQVAPPPPPRPPWLAWLARQEEQVAAWMEQAALPTAPAQFARLAAAFLTGVAVVGGLALGWLPGLALAALAGWLIRLYLARRIATRGEYVAAELPGYLHLIAGSLRSGFSLLHSLEVAAREGPPLLAAEMQRLIQEVNMGTPLEEALVKLARRCANDDMDLFVSAVLISREVGGDLGEILSTLQATIRERLRLRRQIRVLTAQARLSGVIISVLPLLLLLVISTISPDYARILRSTSGGWLLVLAGLTCQGIGAWLIRRILRAGEDLLA